MCSIRVIIQYNHLCNEVLLQYSYKGYDSFEGFDGYEGMMFMRVLMVMWGLLGFIAYHDCIDIQLFYTRNYFKFRD